MNTVVQLATIGISLGAPVWNYIGTFSFIVFVLILFVNVLPLDHTVLHGLWYLTGATTVAAALSYMLRKDTFKIIKSSKHKHS